jgi:hypothetical protein
MHLSSVAIGKLCLGERSVLARRYGRLAFSLMSSHALLGCSIASS